MGLLAAAFPRFNLTPATVEAYYLILCDLDLDLFKAAVLDLAAADSPWFPSAGQIRSAAFRLVDEGQDRPTGADAWGIVTSAIGHYGWCRLPNFDNDLIIRTINAVGGWRLICATPEDMIHTTRARFIDTYDRLDKRAKHQARMLPAVREVAKKLSAPSAKALTDGHDNA
jgi:hypothetical protein